MEGRREWGREKEQMLQQVREMESLKEVEETRRQELKVYIYMYTCIVYMHFVMYVYVNYYCSMCSLII